MNEETIEKIINYFIVKINTLENQNIFFRNEKEKAEKTIKDISDILNNNDFKSNKELLEMIEGVINEQTTNTIR